MNNIMKKKFKNQSNQQMQNEIKNIYHFFIFVLVSLCFVKFPFLF